MDCFSGQNLETVRRLKFYSTVTGAILLHIIIGATLLGNIVTYITSYIRFYVSKENNYGRNIWIQSVSVLAFTIFTIISGYMTRKVPFRGVIFLGVVIISLSNFLTAYALNGSFEYLLLTFGFLQNAGTGLIYSNVIVTSVKWNPDYRGFITGIIIALESISTFVSMQIQTMYFNPDNISPDAEGVPIYFKVASIVFSIIGVIATFLMFLPEQQPTSELTSAYQTNYGTIDEQNGQIHDDNDNASIASSGMFPRGTTLTENLIENDILGILKEEFEREEEYNASVSQTDASTTTVKNYYGVRRALRTRMAMILLITFGLSTNSSYFIAAMGKPFGQTFIFDDHYLAAVISFGNIANCLGSFCCGKILDRIKFKRTMIIVNAIVAASYFSLIFCVYFYPKVLYCIWIMVINFASIGFFSSHLPEVMNKFGEKHATAIYGIIHTGPVITSLSLSPIFELLINYYGWFPTFLTVGFLNFTSMIIIMIFYRKRTLI